MTAFPTTGHSEEEVGSFSRVVVTVSRSAKRSLCRDEVRLGVRSRRTIASSDGWGRDKPRWRSYIARMTTKVHPIPKGYHSLTPFIVCNRAAAAIAFYEQVFDAKVQSRNDGPSGLVMHAELLIGDSILQISDAMPDFGLVAPPSDGSASASLVLYCADVDAVFARAVAAGATVREPVQDFVTGDRFGSLLDHFGRRWAIMTRVEDVSREEADKRVKEWLAKQQ